MKNIFIVVGISALIVVAFVLFGILSNNTADTFDDARTEALEKKAIADMNIALIGLKIGNIDIATYLEDEFAKERNFDDIAQDNKLKQIIETSKAIVTDKVDFIPEFIVYAGKEDYVIKARIQGEEGFLCSDPSQVGVDVIDSSEFNTKNNCLGLPLDTDSDGLKDTFEIRLGTNPNNSDSDGDGFTDTEELNSGHNPNGQ